MNKSKEDDFDEENFDYVTPSVNIGVEMGQEMERDRIIALLQKMIDNTEATNVIAKISRTGKRVSKKPHFQDILEVVKGIK